MAGGRRGITGDGEERGGAGGEGTADGDNGREAASGPEEEGQEGSTGGEEPDTTDQGGEPERRPESSGDRGEEDTGAVGSEGDSKSAEEKPVKAETFHLIYDDSVNNRLFSVITRRSMADIAQAVTELEPGQQETCILVKGEILQFSIHTKAVFQCGDDEVLLS